MMHSGKSIAIIADRIFTGTAWLDNHAIIIIEGMIDEIIPVSSVSPAMLKKTYPGHFIAPAFIDLQIYGASGRLLAVYPDKETLQKMADYSNRGGAAYCLPTVATNARDVFYRSIDAVREYWDSGGKGVLGLHIEGPWINILKRGAHKEELIHTPTLNEARELLDYGKGVIKMITLAPEVCSTEVTELIFSYNIIISAGHSNASYEEATQAFDKGIRSVTHLFNAMSPFQHRAPGLVGAAMDHDKVMASIIPDGHHVDHAAIRIAKKIMGERLYVITDAVTETKSGQYQHTLKGDKYEAAGILSGSALTMLKALKNLVKQGKVELGEALRMCSLYPARLLKIEDQFGEIKKEQQVRLVAIDHKMEVAKLI